MGNHICTCLFVELYNSKQCARSPSRSTSLASSCRVLISSSGKDKCREDDTHTYYGTSIERHRVCAV